MSEFRFLTMEEFGQLPRREKFAYLAEAAAEIEKEGRAVTGKELFKDGPPIPAADSTATS